MENKVDTVICLRMGKTSNVKTPLGDFKITISENPLLSQQPVTSKEISTLYQPTVKLLPPIPNWTCSVVTISHFQ